VIIRSVPRQVMMIMVLILLLPFPAIGQEKLNSVSFKGGIYVPTSDLDDFDNGLYTDVMYNRYFSKHIAMEAGVGLYATKATYNGVLPVVGSFTEEDEITVIPFKINFKGIFPFPIGEFYVGAGIGLYFARAESRVTSTGLGSFSIDDGTAVIGGQFKAGAIFNLNETLFLGFEGEYMLTDTAEFSGSVAGFPVKIESDLNGYAITGVFGFRF